MKPKKRDDTKMQDMQAVDWTQDPMSDPVPGPFAPVRVTMPDRDALLKDIADCLEARRGFAVATLNLDHLVKLRTRPTFRAAYLDHTHVVADGNPIVWLSRLARQPVSLVTGSDLVLPICGVAAGARAPLALIGTTPASLAGATAVLQAHHPGLDIVAAVSPEYGFSLDGEEFLRCVEAIRSSGARVCLLALGAPKQEEFAARALQLLPEAGFVSIGAGLDFLSGSQVRAPAIVRSLALEWLWRMATNPKRLAGRYLSCIAILPGLLRRALVARWRAGKRGSHA